MRSGLTDILHHDLRYALRRITRNPGFTTTAVLSLALGIGANTVIFSIMNTFLFRPLPYTEPGELVNVYRDREGFQFGPLNYPDYLELRDVSSDIFEDLGGFQLVITQREYEDRVEPLVGVLVTGNYFPLLGLVAHYGRTILPEDHIAPGAHPVIVLSHRYWKKSLGKDPAVLGRSIRIAGRDYTIVGVAPEAFTSPIPGVAPDFFAPIMMVGDLMPLESDPLASRGTNSFFPLARLSPGTRLPEVDAVLNTLTQHLRESFPDVWQTGDTLQAVPTAEVVLHPSYDRLVVTANVLSMVMVGLILLVACVNLSGTLLARAVDRRKEVAVRLALGAGRGRLIGQLLTETMLLAAAGGAAGLILASWALHLVNTIPLPGMLNLDIRLDQTVLGFTLTIALVCGVLVGLGPALRATRFEVAPTLKYESAGGGRVRTITTIRFLVAGQIAVSAILLVTAGLFLRSFTTLRVLDPGFGSRPTAMLSFMIPSREYSPAEGRAMVGSFLDEVETLPEVTQVGIVCNPHLNIVNYMFLDVNVAGTPPPPHRSAHMVDFTSVDEGFFTAAGIPFLEGRNFNQGDHVDSRPVAIVNETFARRFWPGESPIGRTITIESPGFPDPTVVGVVRTVKIRSLEEAPLPFIYLPFTQEYNAWVTILAATHDEAGVTAGKIFRMLRESYPDLVVSGCKTMEEHIGILFVLRRLTALLSSLFAGIVLTLAVIGLHGVVRYAVSRRWREMGIRMSLGADPRSVLMLTEGIRLALFGGGAGIVIALAATRLFRPFLFGVGAADPATFTTVAAVLLMVSLTAAFPPALLAGRVDPAVVLRSE